MKTLFTFLAIFALSLLPPSTALAVNAKFVCTFDPPSDVAVGEAGVEYAVGITNADGSWTTFATGAGEAAGQVDGKLAIEYSHNVSFGNYVVQVRISKPVPGPSSDLSNIIAITPGKPGKPTISSSRSVSSALSVEPEISAPKQVLVTVTKTPPGNGKGKNK